MVVQSQIWARHHCFHGKWYYNSKHYYWSINTFIGRSGYRELSLVHHRCTCFKCFSHQHIIGHIDSEMYFIGNYSANFLNLSPCLRVLFFWGTSMPFVAPFILEEVSQRLRSHIIYWETLVAVVCEGDALPFTCLFFCGQNRYTSPYWSPCR